MTRSVHSDVQDSSYASDMHILMENMQALNVNNRQDDLLLTNSVPLKYKEQHSMIPVRHYTPQTYRSNSSQSYTTETSDVYMIEELNYFKFIILFLEYF